MGDGRHTLWVTYLRGKQASEYTARRYAVFCSFPCFLPDVSTNRTHASYHTSLKVWISPRVIIYNGRHPRKRIIWLCTVQVCACLSSVVREGAMDVPGKVIGAGIGNRVGETGFSILGCPYVVPQIFECIQLTSLA